MSIKTVTALGTQYTTDLADNVVGAISPADVRGAFVDTLDSLQVYGALYVSGASSAQALTTTPAKLTAWTVNGASNGTTVDHTADSITIGANSAGTYRLEFTCSFVGVTSSEYIFQPYVNAGAVSNVTMRRTPSDTNPVAVSLTAILTGINASDAISIYAYLASGSQNITVKDAQLVIQRIPS